MYMEQAGMLIRPGTSWFLCACVWCVCCVCVCLCVWVERKSYKSAKSLSDREVMQQTAHTSPPAARPSHQDSVCVYVCV